jgi:hypothetical protein
MIFALQSSMIGQHYFSTVLPADLLSSDARTLSMGYGMNPLFQQSAEHPFRLRIDFDARSMTETRSFPIIDMFDDVVTDNVYVINRLMTYSTPWTLSADLSKWIHQPVSVSITQSPFWDFRYNYKEEVRASLGPGVYNRDPVAGYHIFRMDGIIQSTQFDVAIHPISFFNIGMSFESFTGQDLFQQKGVKVLLTDDALASDSTNIMEYDLNLDNTNRWTLGLDVILANSIMLGFSMKSAVGFLFKTDGYVPVLDERTQLPGLTKADTLSSYMISLPSEFSLMFSSRLNNKIKSFANGRVTYSDWSQTDEIMVKGVSTDTVNFHYQSTWSIHLGVEHWVLNQTPFRFGFTYSDSPLGDNFEQTMITLGTGWTYEHFTLDIGTAFGRVEYRYSDLFVPTGQDADNLEEVKESVLSVKASLTYSF